MENKDYKDLVEYIDMAKKTIRAFSNKICPGICKQMTNSEDAIADIAYAMMCADWKYDVDRRGKISNKPKTKYSYRNQCAIWAIQTYIKKYLKGGQPFYLNSLLGSEDDSTFNDILEDSGQEEPIDEIIFKEKTNLESQLIKDIFESDILTDNQKNKLKLYYLEGFSLAKIGKKYGVTREAVRQNIKNSITKIKESFA
jgi:RNA polymerase sigma factor (sigma-70 family)